MKIKTILFAALLLPLSVLAENKALVIELNSGQTSSFLLLEKPVMTMADTELNITTASIQASFLMADVKRFYFSEETNDIKTLRQEGFTFSQIDGDNLEITGLSSKDHITIFDMAGHQLGSASISEGKANVCISGYKQGIYFIKTGSQTIKFLKK